MTHCTIHAAEGGFIFVRVGSDEDGIVSDSLLELLPGDGQNFEGLSYADFRAWLNQNPEGGMARIDGRTITAISDEEDDAEGDPGGHQQRHDDSSCRVARGTRTRPPSLVRMSTYVAVFALVLAYVALVAAYFALRTLAKLRRATAALGRTPGRDEADLTQLQAVEETLGGLGVPVVARMDIGHTQPFLPLVNGARALAATFRALREMTALMPSDITAPRHEADDQPIPRSIDEFREALAVRIERIVRAHRSGAGAGRGRGGDHGGEPAQ